MKLPIKVLIFFISLVTLQIEAQDYYEILPTDFSPVTTAKVKVTTEEVTESEITPTYCALGCIDRPGCEFYLDQELCECIYTCTKTPEETTETETTEEITETTVTACALPFCEFGYDNCFSCNDCKCNPPPTLTPVFESTTVNVTSCEQPSDPFCFSQIFDGQCMTACCSLPYCESGVDWNYCVSCFQCRCLPPPTQTVVTDVTASTSCDIRCEYQPGCTFYANKLACRCEYDCSTTGPTRKPRTKKLKCGPAF